MKEGKGKVDIFFCTGNIFFFLVEGRQLRNSSVIFA